MNKTKIKKYGKNLLLLLITIILFLVFFEFILRIFPGLLGQAVQNNLLTKYNDREDGIYFFDSNAWMHSMKPNFETVNYYSGLYWIHKTDSKGFRNEKEYNKADIILLGDSIIYGHGLDYNKTAAFFLEKESNYLVYNLSRQGDCAFQQKYNLFKRGIELKPKYVFYFFYENDLFDLDAYLTKKEMQYFIEEQDLTDFSFKKIREKGTESTYDYLIRQLTYSSYTGIALNTLYNLQVVKPRKLYFESFKTITDDFNSIEWQYTEKAIKQMKYLTDSVNSEFIIVPVTENQNQLNKLKLIAKESNSTILEIKEIINEKELWIKKDGHLTENGQKKLSESLLNFIKEKEVKQ